MRPHGQISGTFLMTVEEGGRWYVSPSYTLAEYGREAFGLPEPEFGAWRDQVGPGASSPSEVLESFAAAASALDSDLLADAIESGGGNPIPELEVKGALAPGEFAALFDYAPSFQTVDRGADRHAIRAPARSKPHAGSPTRSVTSTST